MNSTIFFGCSVCFGDPNSMQAVGLMNGVTFLILIIGSVLSVIGFTAYRWAKRAKQIPIP